MTTIFNISIIIWPFDNGSGIVLINEVDYIEQAENELNNNSTYDEVHNDLTNEVTNKVKNPAKKMHPEGCITMELEQYLPPSNPKPDKAKGNPKMPKKGHTLRINISGIDYTTERKIR